MKLSLVLALVFSVGSAFAYEPRYFDFYDNLFAEQNLCFGVSAEMKKDEKSFKKMYATLKADFEAGKESTIDVVEDSAYSTMLENKKTYRQCAINQHDDCYSASCE